MSLCERGTGSASNLPPSAGRATSMPVARARRYVLAILRRGPRAWPASGAPWPPGPLAPGPQGLGCPYRGCPAGKKRGASVEFQKSFIFRIIHPLQYTQSRTRLHRCTGRRCTRRSYVRGAGGRGVHGRMVNGLTSRYPRPWSGHRPVRSRLSGQTHPQTSRSAPAHPGARAPEGLGRTADRTLTPITRAGRAPRPPLSSP